MASFCEYQQLCHALTGKWQFSTCLYMHVHKRVRKKTCRVKGEENVFFIPHYTFMSLVVNDLSQTNQFLSLLNQFLSLANHFVSWLNRFWSFNMQNPIGCWTVFVLSWLIFVLSWSVFVIDWYIYVIAWYFFVICCFRFCQ